MSWKNTVRLRGMGALALCLGFAGVAAGQPVISGSLPAFGEVNVAYSGSLSATDGMTTCCMWSIIAGALPDGLIIDPNSGAISGNPTSANTFNFTVQASDANGPITENLSITVYPQLQVTTGATLPGGTQGQSYNVPLAASGGNQNAYSWSLGTVTPGAPWLSL